MLWCRLCLCLPLFTSYKGALMKAFICSSETFKWFYSSHLGDLPCCSWYVTSELTGHISFHSTNAAYKTEWMKTKNLQMFLGLTYWWNKNSFFSHSLNHSRTVLDASWAKRFPECGNQKKKAKQYKKQCRSQTIYLMKVTKDHLFHTLNALFHFGPLHGV